MISFSYTINDKIGLHARPAGALAKKAKQFKSEILIEKNNRSVNATKLMMLMGLGIKCGDTVTVSIVGPDEGQASAEIKNFFLENL